jgi:cytochrome c553
MMKATVGKSNDIVGRRRAHGLAACVVAIGLFGVGAASGEDIALGQYLSNECVACHQLSGQSAGAIPPIVGWPIDQFIAAIHTYRNKERDNVIMQTIAGRLNDEEIRALAAYFGSLEETASQ